MSSGISISSCPWIETYKYTFQYICWFWELWYHIFVSLVCANILFRGLLLFLDDLIMSLEKKFGFKVYPLNKLGKMRYHTLWLDHWWKSYYFHLFQYILTHIHLPNFYQSEQKLKIKIEYNHFSEYDYTTI